MKICLYGAGSIGGIIGAHLARVKGVEVSLIARGAHLDAIRPERPAPGFAARGFHG